jgi:hypothetical protein
MDEDKTIEDKIIIVDKHCDSADIYLDDKLVWSGYCTEIDVLEQVLNALGYEVEIVGDSDLLEDNPDEPYYEQEFHDEFDDINWDYLSDEKN